MVPATQPQQFVPPLPGQVLNAPPNIIVSSVQPLPPLNMHTPGSYMPVLTGSLLPLSSSYQFGPPSYAGSIYETGSQMAAPIVHSETLYPGGNSLQTKSSEDSKTDWIEHASATGRRYYYNKKTQVSSWEKPYELMTPIEKADASTNWKEYSSPDGRKYYYNKVTTQSKWEMPEELKLARERLLNEAAGHTSPAKSEDTLKPVHGDRGSSADPASAETSSLPSNSPMPGATGQLPASGNDSFKDHYMKSGKSSERSSLERESSKLNYTGEKDPNDTVDGKESVTNSDKQDGRLAFKALLESSNVGSDWTWEQAMRIIINDQRYGALKTLAERKQAFNEFLAQRRKQETEEKRMKHKKARHEFRQMLLESEELSSSTRWSKAIAIFENDLRFKAVDRERDRRDLFEDFLKELNEKERVKAQEERKQNITAYRQYLESCDFIKPNTQWRKVQDRLEADERCSRLEKIDRLEIFQDYLRDLDKEEEEQKKIQKEEIRKTERKNRDEFRKMMDADVNSGFLTAKTQWRGYYTKIKDSPIYLAVSSNISGSTPKDLFEDVIEELQKQYHDDKSRVKDAIKKAKFPLTSMTTLEELKNAIADDVCSPPLSEVNLKLLFEDLLERAKEKAEKETKKRKRVSDEFFNLLTSIKEIALSSKWEEFKADLEESREFRHVGDENVCREMFEEYVSQLKDQSKETDRKRMDEKVKKEKDRDDKDRRRSKHKRDKEKTHEKHSHDEEVDVEMIDNDDSKHYKDNRRRHERTPEAYNDSEKDRSRSSHKHHSSGHKKSRRHANSDSDTDTKRKKHRKDHRIHRNGDDIEDGEFGDGSTR